VPGATVEKPKLVYQEMVESIFLRALAGRLDAATLARLQEAGLDLERPLQPAYPLEAWNRCIAIAAEALFHRADGSAYFELGRLFAASFNRGFIGAAMFRFAGQVGIKRALNRPRSYERMTNFTHARLRDLGPQGLELDLSGGQSPAEFTQGSLQSSLEAMGARSAQVLIVERRLEGTTFHLTWDDR
jgi:uncharacterized protein (TIGR02265 family)